MVRRGSVPRMAWNIRERKTEHAGAKHGNGVLMDNYISPSTTIRPPHS